MSEFKMLDPMLNHRLLDQHSHAIINRIRHPEVPFGLRAISLVPKGFEPQERLFPWLVPLGNRAIGSSAKTDLLNEIDRLSGGDGRDRTSLEAPSVVMLLACDIDDVSLMRNLASRLIVALPDGSRAMLRWHDPEVLMQLQWMVNAGSLNNLLAPIRRISFWLAGHWYSLTPRGGRVSSILRMDENEIVQLSRIGMINQVLKETGWSTIDELTGTSKRIDVAITRAVQVHGLVREEDLVAFATHAMTVHSRFDEHPRIARLLSEVKARRLEQDPQTYFDASAMLTTTAWRDVAAQIQLAGSTNS